MGMEKRVLHPVDSELAFEIVELRLDAFVDRFVLARDGLVDVRSESKGRIATIEDGLSNSSASVHSMLDLGPHTGGVLVTLHLSIASGKLLEKLNAVQQRWNVERGERLSDDLIFTVKDDLRSAEET